jgi:hypothetical protein
MTSAPGIRLERLGASELGRSCGPKKPDTPAKSLRWKEFDPARGRLNGQHCSFAASGAHAELMQ